MKTFMHKIVIVVSFVAMSLHCWAIDGFIVQTTDYSFSEKWSCTSNSSIAIIPEADTVFRDQKLYVTAIAGDYQLAANKMADVTYSIKIFRPDKTIYAQYDNMPILKGKVQNVNLFQMSEYIISLVFEDDDILGTYQIEVVITDNVAKTEKNLESKVVLCDLPSYNNISLDEQAIGKWTTQYYLDPHPEQALPVYINLAQQGMIDDESAFWPILSMMREIYLQNQFLQPQLLDCFASQDAEIQYFLLFLIHYIGIDDDNFRSTLDSDNQAIITYLDSIPFPNIYGEIYSPVLFDMLWGNFMASGSYKPVLKLIHSLDYAKYKKYENSLKKVDIDNMSEDEMNKLINYMSYNALVWALSSNCEQHPLVRQYCEWALQYEKLSGLQRKELKKILKK